MANLKLFHSETGLRACHILDGEIIDSYLLTDEELSRIVDLNPLLDFLSDDFTIGVVENENGEKYCIIKIEDGFLISPVHTDNIGEIYKKVTDCIGGLKNGG